jgi:uncharacterized HAD superfamily protein
MPKPENKLTIAVDIDDVLTANAEGFVEFSNKKWGTSLTPDDYDEHWAEIWKVSYEEENRRRDEILANDLFLSYRFFDEAKPALEKLKQNHKLVVVSSRSKHISDDTTEWIKTHFKDIFSEIHYAGIWDDLEKSTLEKLKLTKAEVCRQIGADYLIDDQPKHCLAADVAGIKALLFGDYKWTKVSDLPSSIIRVKNWQEVLEYFDGRSN